MGMTLKNCNKNRELMRFFFNEEETKLIDQRTQDMKINTVVFCSFESRFAKSGGLAAVTIQFPEQLQKLPQVEKTVLITPFYPHIINESKLEQTGLTVEVPLGDKVTSAHLLKYVHDKTKHKKNRVEEFYLKAEGYFEARNRLNDPYIYHADDLGLNNAAIRENALFFSRALPLVAATLGLKENVVFHLQEWQTALTALTAKIAMVEGTLFSCAQVQTIHNPFDDYFDNSMLERIMSADRFQQYLSRGGSGYTAFELGLQLADAPISTVSENFAKEFTDDIFHSHHFAPHLQEIFKSSGIYGINNGMFTDFPTELKHFSKGKTSIAELKAIKKRKRAALLDILDQYHPDGRFGTLNYQGGPLSKLPDHVPILVMTGRLDPIQKGYDIFLRAVEMFEPGQIKVVLTPMPVHDADLDCFYKTANRCNGDVTVFPIRMTEGFHELLTGSTFGLMPSIYEPFGAAVDYMVNGTLTIARDTGGLRDQVMDGSDGLLFKEDPALYTLENIEAFCDAANQTELRRHNLWTESMVENLYHTIIKAAHIYKNKPDDYFTMVLNGFKKALKFSWTENTNQYYNVYSRVNTF